MTVPVDRHENLRLSGRQSLSAIYHPALVPTHRLPFITIVVRVRLPASIFALTALFVAGAAVPHFAAASGPELIEIVGRVVRRESDGVLFTQHLTDKYGATLPSSGTYKVRHVAGVDIYPGRILPLRSPGASLKEPMSSPNSVFDRWGIDYRRLCKAGREKRGAQRSLVKTLSLARTEISPEVHSVLDLVAAVKRARIRANPNLAPPYCYKGLLNIPSRPEGIELQILPSQSGTSCGRKGCWVEVEIFREDEKKQITAEMLSKPRSVMLNLANF